MKLILKGKINKTYVQTLCIMFFHGEKFPLNDDNEDNYIEVKQTEDDNGISAFCTLFYNGKMAHGRGYAYYNPDEAIERTSKTAVGKAVYQAGAQVTGKEIPWGILTGIRPSKVAYEVLKLHNKEEANDVLIDRYLLSPTKAELCLDVAQNEYSIVNQYSDKACSVYISIPFCPSRCTYCSFISYATKKLFDLIPDYIEAIKKELSQKASIIKKLNLEITSLYIGGGTPTTLNSQQLQDLLSYISLVINVKDLKEFTVECGRPDTITLEKLLILEKYGVNRISINPQTLNDEVLCRIGRKHTVDDFFKAYTIAKQNTSLTINVDLIAGLEGDTIESFKSTIDKIIELGPQNITVHSFSVKKSAQALADDKGVYELNGDFAKESVDYAYKTIRDHNYQPYYMYRQKNTISDLENVGYSKQDYFSIYNILMMSDCHTVFGIGAGASTKLVKNVCGKNEILRIFSPKYPYEYLKDKKDKTQDIFDFFKEV
ncbi:MAG: coproporphyrinogen dehydrogenase HemZ [Clostridia bacterium]|nr:coproporphyrinogen dehydrogenase HemZ [Clostridia bacterium]